MICKACYEAAYLRNGAIDGMVRLQQNNNNGALERIVDMIVKNTIDEVFVESDHLVNYHCTCPPREGVENGKTT